jgi:hypothetical protein
MNTEKIKELRQLLAAATAGPWERGSDGGDIIYGAEWQGSPVHVAGVPFRPGDKRVAADAALIAAAREALPALLDEVEALTSALVLIRDSTFRNSVTLRGIADNALTARHEPKATQP